ncbi:MAG: arsenic resistance N-acetyltransferase ArsN2 [Steroidobacteraceae bacterium]
MTPVRAASAADLTAIRTLLESAGLPTSDLETARPQLLAIRDGDALVAAGALQCFGKSALVRSVVVAPGYRGKGLGESIVLALERAAKEARIEQLILLTRTAAPFFSRHGYRVIERGEAPVEVRGAEEFRSLCPSSATCMSKSLA